MAPRSAVPASPSRSTRPQLGTTSSSRRYKEEIVDIGERATSSCSPARRLLYKPGIRCDATRQYGPIAEEVDELAPGLVARDRDGRIETVRYPLVNAMLLRVKSRRMIDELRAGRAELLKHEAMDPEVVPPDREASNVTPLSPEQEVARDEPSRGRGRTSGQAFDAGMAGRAPSS